MADAKQKPTANKPHSVYVLNEEYQKTYVSNILDKFLDEFVFAADKENLSHASDYSSLASDGIWCYAANFLRTFLLLADMKDAVAAGNGDHLLIIRKQLLVHFFGTAGFNELAIEMLINILQCEVLLSKAEAHRCKWGATVNWKGGIGNNIEIDLFQEDRNSEMKKLVKSMGVNKIEKAITRASKATGGVTKIVEQVNIHPKSSVHSHKSSADDEKVISRDLRSLRPFKSEEGRSFESFVGISDNPTDSFDDTKFKEWLKKHKNNILMHYPVVNDQEQSDETDAEQSDNYE